MNFRRAAVVGLCAVGAIVGIGSNARASYVTVDLSGFVDTSFDNLINATAVPYPVGLNNLGSNLTGVPFDIAGTTPTESNGVFSGYGLNYWGGFLGTPADRGTTLAITGLDIADVTTAYTLVNSTFGTVDDFPTTIKFVTTGGA
jgi:hypothetical protein